jgi:DNA-binding response OmpR family regulator
MRILLVEDDAMIGDSLRLGLQDEGYAVDWVRNGKQAIAALDTPNSYSAMLLDWRLPGADGITVLQTVRGRDATLPVLMLTARDAIEDRVLGLDSGADDYLVKPFELSELKARLRSLLRRSQGRATPLLSNGHLTLNPATHEVTCGGQPVQLSAREFAVLHALLERPGIVLSRTQLEERIYGWESSVQSNAVEFLIHALRRKLGRDAIENLRGAGWRVPART